MSNQELENMKMLNKQYKQMLEVEAAKLMVCKKRIRELEIKIKELEASARTSA